jgi:hypothetical protein
LFKLSEQGEFIRSTSDSMDDDGEAFSDVVWSRQGPAHVLVRSADEVAVRGPRHWTAHLKGVALPEQTSRSGEVSLSPSALRFAVLSQPADAVGGALRVYSLDQRVFFDEIPQESFAIAPDADWIALERERPRRGAGFSVDLFAIDASGTLARLEVPVSGAVSCLHAAAGELLVVSRDAQNREIVQRFEVSKTRDAMAWTVTPRELEGGRPFFGCATERSAGVSTSAGDRETTLSPHGEFEIRSPAGQRDIQDVVHRTSGKRVDLPQLTDRKKLRFSDDDRWLAFWDDRGIEVIDLERRQHVVKLDAPRVSDVFFAGAGAVLGMQTAKQVVLVPLRRAWVEAFALSTVTRKLDDRERCTYLKTHCDRAP